MLKIEINKQLSAKFLKMMKEAPEKCQRGIEIALRRCGDQMRNEAGRNAPFKTGNLRRSITMELGKDYVIVGSNLEYSRIQDQGGTIKAHTIFPKKSKVLRFVINGRVVFAKKANIPARTVKPYQGKGYLTPAFEKLANGEASAIFMKEIQAIFN